MMEFRFALLTIAAFASSMLAATRVGKKEYDMATLFGLWSLISGMMAAVALSKML